MIELFNFLIVTPIINCLLLIYHVLISFHISNELGFSIIVLTLVLRLLLYPLTTQQLKASKKMQDLTPHLNRLKEQHKNDAKRLQTETMSLYKEHGVNPASGCITMLVQLPIIWGIYAVFQEVVRLSPTQAMAQINKVAYADFLKLTTPWSTDFFGLPLEKTPSQLLAIVGILILLVPIITGVLQFIQSRLMFKKPEVDKNAKKVVEKKKSDGSMDFASAFQTQSLYIFPLMFGFLSYTFPLGLSLYWNTFTFFGIIQQYRLQKGAKVVIALPEKTKKKK